MTFVDESEHVKINDFTIAVRFEILEHSLVDMEHLVKFLIDCEEKHM